MGDEKWVPDLARAIFMAHTIRNGALLPGGFGFLSPKDKAVWYDKARNVFVESPPIGGENE